MKKRMMVDVKVDVAKTIYAIASLIWVLAWIFA